MWVEGTAVEGRGQDRAWLTAAAGQVRGQAGPVTGPLGPTWQQLPRSCVGPSEEAEVIRAHALPQGGGHSPRAPRVRPAVQPPMK